MCRTYPEDSNRFQHVRLSLITHKYKRYSQMYNKMKIKIENKKSKLIFTSSPQKSTTKATRLPQFPLFYHWKIVRKKKKPPPKQLKFPLRPFNSYLKPSNNIHFFSQSLPLAPSLPPPLLVTPSINPNPHSQFSPHKISLIITIILMYHICKLNGLLSLIFFLKSACLISLTHIWTAKEWSRKVLTREKK